MWSGIITQIGWNKKWEKGCKVSPPFFLPFNQTDRVGRPLQLPQRATRSCTCANYCPHNGTLVIHPNSEAQSPSSPHGSRWPVHVAKSRWSVPCINSPHKKNQPPTSFRFPGGGEEERVWFLRWSLIRLVQVGNRLRRSGSAGGTRRPTIGCWANSDPALHQLNRRRRWCDDERLLRSQVSRLEKLLA